VSFRFLCLTLASTILLAFAIGRAGRIILLEGPRRALLVEDPLDSSMYDRPDYHESGTHRKKLTLPEPMLMEGKEVPRTVYSSKTFSSDTATSTTVQLNVKKTIPGQTTPEKDVPEEGRGICRDEEGKSKGCSRGKLPEVIESFEKEDEEEEHLPAGQHLLVDIKNVNGAFLNSEERLAQATIDVVNDSELTLLSYHCHSLIPMGVSCVGVLLESHVSFHTWPDEGVITLDLFTCGSKPLVPVLPVIERLFAIPRKGSLDGEQVEQPVVVWSHKLRGFRTNNHDDIKSDLDKDMLSMMEFDMKKEIVSTRSKFQRIDVFEVINPRFNDLISYHRSLSMDGSYESLHPELYQPDRILYLEGAMQSSLYGDEAYHESLVHPGMFSHPDPRRVAIIGGGEGATLREVLKHRTVEKAVMIEIDQEMVEVSHEALPSWSDCSNLVDSADWCVEDKRVDMYYEDALAWFINRFGEESNSLKGTEAPFDVIIMDALDPTDDVPFAKALYDNDTFLRALYSGLSDNGVIVMQLGESPGLTDPAETHSKHYHRGRLTKLCNQVGFKSLNIYDEGHNGFQWPWTYFVAFKHIESRALWYSNPAQVELMIQRRILPTKAGPSSLNYYDGATQKNFQVPHKVFETVFCRTVPTPKECKTLGFKNKHAIIPKSSFEVRKSGAGEIAGRGVFTKKNIEEESLIIPEDTINSVRIYAAAVELIYSYCEAGGNVCSLEEWMDGYGWEVSALVS